jgi:GNAT superfamily N-acetyltransferase
MRRAKRPFYRPSASGRGLIEVKARRAPGLQHAGTPPEDRAMSSQAPQDGGSFLPYSAETLADGRQVMIRPMNPGDFDAERAFVDALSPRSRRNRFQEQIRDPDAELVAELVDVDHERQEAFAAFEGGPDAERIVGVARYIRTSEPGACEVAVAVLDDWQGKGLGTALMRRLVDAARRRGLKRMVSLDFAENHEMTHLARFLGFRTEVDAGDRTQLLHTLEL